MGPIPLVNVMAVVHLCFVAAFLGLYLAETVVESYGTPDDRHPIAVQIHYLLDIFAEIPMAFGALVTGIIMAFLVDELTLLHIILITCGSLTFLTCVFTFFRYVRTRRRVIDTEPIDYKELKRIRNRFCIFVFTIFNPALCAAFIIGFWLAYHRVVESIYG